MVYRVTKTLVLLLRSDFWAISLKAFPACWNLASAALLTTSPLTRHISSNTDVTVGCQFSCQGSKIALCHIQCIFFFIQSWLFLFQKHFCVNEQRLVLIFRGKGSQKSLY